MPTTSKPSRIFRKLSAKHVVWVMPLLLSAIMSALVSMVSMLNNLGWVEGFLNLWLHSWLLSWMIAFPSVLMVLPIVRKLVALLVDVPKAPL